MSDLAEALELLHDASDRWTTLRCTISSRRHTEFVGRAHERWRQQCDAYNKAIGAISASAPLRVTASRDSGPQPEYQQSLQRLWMAKPDRLRSEFAYDLRHTPQVHLVIRNGPDEWSRMAVQAAQHDRIEPGSSHAVGDQALFSPETLLCRELTLRARGIVDGREVILLGVTPHLHARMWHGVGADAIVGHHGADDIEVGVDVTTGLVLLVVARLEGFDYSVTEVRDLVVDELLDEALFTFVPEAGEKVTEDRHRHRNLGPDDGAEAPFTILVPALPFRNFFHVHLTGEGETALSSLHWSQPPGINGADVNVWERAASQAEPDSLGFEEIERDGERLRVRRHPGQDGEPEWWAVEIVRAGTRARLQSSLPREELIGLAVGLHPMATDPPRLVDL